MKNLALLFLLSTLGLSLPVYAQLNCDSTCVTPQTINFPKTKTVTSTKTLPGQITFGSQCGASAGSILTGPPNSFLCNNGTPSSVSTVNNAGDISYTWTCTIPSGASTNCAAFQREIGTCGSSNGTTVSSDPTNLCATGSSSGLSLVGSIYTWKCNGNYGTPASCSANLAPPTPPPACYWSSSGGQPIPITVGTNYSMVYPAYTAYGIMTNADFGVSTLPSISEAYQFYGAPWEPATTPPGMYWITSLDGFNSDIHIWKFTLVGTPTAAGSFGGFYVASCGLGYTSVSFFSYTVNAAPMACPPAEKFCTYKLASGGDAIWTLQTKTYTEQAGICVPQTTITGLGRYPSGNTPPECN